MTTDTGLNSELDPFTLEKHKTLAMWEAVEEAKQLVTQSRGMTKENAGLVEETRDLRDETKEDRQAMAELLKKQTVLLDKQAAMQQDFGSLIVAQQQALERQKAVNNDLLDRLNRVEKHLDNTENKLSNRVDLRFIDFGMAVFFGIASYVLFIQFLGPIVVTWVGGLFA